MVPITTDVKVVPIFRGTLYNPYQFSFQDKTYILDDNLFVYASINPDNTYDTFMSYNEEDYSIEYQRDGIMKVTKITANQDSYEQYTFEGNEEVLLINMRNIVIRYCLAIIFFLFVPLSNVNFFSYIDSRFTRSKQIS